MVVKLPEEPEVADGLEPADALEAPEEVELELEEPLKEPPDVIANWLDWARMLVGWFWSWMKLTWKPFPTGHPPLGGLTVMELWVPSTDATRSWLLLGKMLASWLTRRTAKVVGSVSTRLQEMVLTAFDCQPVVLLGEVTWYARALSATARTTESEANIARAIINEGRV